MAGTKAGAAKAALTNKKRYGEEFYKTIGKKGGISPKTKPAGFAANRELAKIAGKKGGSTPRVKRDK
jgi:general stress protein YciG